MSTFPVTESTLSAVHLADFLKEKYGLGAGATCKLLRTGMNHMYLVNAGDMKAVFRVYNHNWRTRLEIEEEVRLELHLKNNDVPVSYPLPDAGGNFVQQIHAPEGLRYGVLFSFAEGKKNPRFDAETAFHIGKTVAKFHGASENFDLKRISYNSDNMLWKPLEVIKAFFTANVSEISFLEKTAGYLAEQYKIAELLNLRKGALHLDIWFDNMHITEGNKITLFDFDFCGNGWLCFDTGYFLYQLLNTNPDEKEYAAKTEAFWKGYESVFPISAEEKEITPHVTLCIIVFYLSKQCETWDTWSNIFLNEDHLKRFTGSIQRWIKYHGIEIE